MKSKLHLVFIMIFLSTLACGLPSAAPAEPTVNALPPTPNLPVSVSLAPQTEEAESAFNVNLPASACWINSNVSVRSGQSVEVSASGTINTWNGNQISFNDPNGQAQNICQEQSCPLPGIGYGTLVGKVGDSQPFQVGASSTFTAQQDGQLYFTVNDWECSDNSGTFDLIISIK